MNSGPFVGVVDDHALFDMTASCRLARLPGSTISLTGMNLFDSPSRDFLGAPEVGRLLMLRLGYEC